MNYVSCFPPVAFTLANQANVAAKLWRKHVCLSSSCSCHCLLLLHWEATCFGFSPYIIRIPNHIEADHFLAPVGAQRSSHVIFIGMHVIQGSGLPVVIRYTFKQPCILCNFANPHKLKLCNFFPLSLGLMIYSATELTYVFKAALRGVC